MLFYSAFATTPAVVRLQKLTYMTRHFLGSSSVAKLLSVEDGLLLLLAAADVSYAIQ